MNQMLEQRKQRWTAIMDPDADVRMLFTVFFRDDPEIPARPWPHPENREKLHDWALRKYETQTARLNWLDDDTLPFLDLSTGTEIFAESFGCPVQHPSNNMPFALPLVNNAAEAARLKIPSLESTALYDRILDAERLRDRAGGDALVRLPDLQTPMDVTALIWEKASFFMALIEEPEAILDLAAKASTLIMEFLDAWFARMGTEYIAHFPDYYMSGGITVSEDEIGAISPDMFDELFLPELIALSERYGGMGLHCCADAQHQWAGLAKIPGLRLLNLIQPQDVLAEAFERFESHCVQLHGWENGQPRGYDPETYTGPARLVLTPFVSSGDEAKQVAERLAPLRNQPLKEA